MWAWLRITAPSVRGSTGGAAQLRRRSSFRPWKSPQSRSTRLAAVLEQVLGAGDRAPGAPEEGQGRGHSPITRRRAPLRGRRAAPRGGYGPGPGGELEQLLLGGLHALGDETLEVEPRLQRRDRLRFHAGGGMPGREERAAVGVRLDGDLVGPERVGLPGDLELVHADQRPEDRHRGHLVDARQVVERLRGHLPQALAGDEGERARVAGQALRDADHQPAVDHDAERRRHRQHDFPLDLTEGHDEQARVVLPLGQPRHELARLAAREIRQVGRAVEVHEDHAAAAPHQAPRGHRRVDAAREQGRHRAAGAHRQAARAGLRIAVDEGLVGQHLHAHVQLRVLEAHPHVGPQREHVGAQVAVELHRGHREGLEGAPGGDAEGAEGAARDRLLHRGPQRLARHAGPDREGEVGHARDPRQPLGQEPAARGGARDRA